MLKTKKLICLFLTLISTLLVLKCAKEDNGTQDTANPDTPYDFPIDVIWDGAPDTGVDSIPDIGIDSPTDTGHDISADLGTDTSTGGELCDPCETDDDCGGPNDYCLRNTETGEVLCGKHCTSGADCPAEFSCVEIPTETGTINQCVPDSGTCLETPPDCDPPCSEGEICRDGVCVPVSSDDLQHCVDVINSYRSTMGRAPLTRSSEIEACAAEGAEYDALHGTPHGHFSSTGGCGGVAYGENEIPGWPLDWYGSVRNIIEEGTAMMWDEGPGGGHYENIIGPYTHVGCGIYITSANEVWVVQDFR